MKKEVTGKNGKSRKVIKIIAIVLACIILLPVITLSVGRGVNYLRLRLPNGVWEKGYIELGGVEHYIYIRGADTSNPVVIFLHGGPGGSAFFIGPEQRSFDEAEYTFIYYDQRGSGKSYLKSPTNVELSIDLLLSDLDELVDYVSERFGQPIVIVGSSWGTVLGTLYAEMNPDKIAGYIGVSQVVDFNDMEVHRFDSEENEEKIRTLIESARKAGNEQDALRIEELYGYLMSKMNEQGFFDESAFKDKDFISNNDELAILIDKYDPSPPQEDTEMQNLKIKDWKDWFFYWTVSALLSPDFDWDNFRWFLFDNNKMEYKKYEDIQEPLMQFLYNYSPPETLKIPVVFISGSTDVVTPVDLVQEYYERLTAPKKDIFIMQGAGHNPSAEVDSMKAYAEIIKKALAFILE